MTKPFTYLIKCKPTNQYYYGVKYAKGCSPDDLWSTYFTSSIYVKQLVLEHGKDAFEYEIRKTFSSVNKAKLWEEKVLRKLGVSKRDDFINKYDFVAYDLKSRVWVNNTMESKFIDIVLLDEYLQNGWIKGRLFSDKHKEALSKNAQHRHSNPANNPMYGRKHSQKSKIKNRSSQLKARKNNPNLGRKISIEEANNIRNKFAYYNPQIPKTPHGKQLTKRGLFCRIMSKEYSVSSGCISNILNSLDE